MKIIINKHKHVHYRHDEKMDRKINSLHQMLTAIHKLVLTIIKKEDQIMTNEEREAKSLSDLNEATNAIAARIQKLIDAGAGNVTEAQLNELQADADALKLIGNPPAQA